MSKHLIPFDISNHPDLLRLAEEIRTTKTPRALTQDNTTLAVVMPVGTTLQPKKNRAKTKADYEVSLAAIGSWSDLPADEMIAKVSRWRKEGSRPLARP